MDHNDLKRRTVLRGTALGAVAAPVLAACGEDSPASSGTPGGGGFTPPTPTETPTDGKPAAEVLATTGDIAVGKAIFIDSANVPGDAVPNGIVVTQPTAGEFHAFSRDCTHNHCAVADIRDGKLHCPCHDSLYDMATGANVSGPAPAPLTEVPIKVKGKNIVRA